MFILVTPYSQPSCTSGACVWVLGTVKPSQESFRSGLQSVVAPPHPGPLHYKAAGSVFVPYVAQKGKAVLISRRNCWFKGAINDSRN